MKRSKRLSLAALGLVLINSVGSPRLLQPVVFAGTTWSLSANAGQKGFGIPRFGPGTNNSVTFGPMNDPTNLREDPKAARLADHPAVIQLTDSFRNRGLTGVNKNSVPGKSGQPDAETLLSKLPLSFVENRGQSNDAVRFEVKAQHHKIYFTRTEVVFASAPSLNGKRKVEALRMKFDGASPNPSISGTDLLAGKFNFFEGKDPANWNTDVPSYKGIAYKNLYKGVDLVFRDAQGKLERDFVIAPGVDPKTIRMKYEGAKKLCVSEEGELVINAQSSVLTESKPEAYQTIEGRRVEVEAVYKVAKNGHVGFEVGAYDRSQPLVIDPILRFSTYIGGNTGEIGHAIAVDATGIYIVGVPGVINFPVTGTFGPFDGFSFDTFAAKLAPDGSSLIYSDIIRGSSRDVALAAQVHPFDGTLYILTGTSSADFPTTAGAFDTTYNGGDDYVVTRVNAAGNGFVWSTYIGGAGTELELGGIDVYNNGDCWFVGGTSSLGPTQSANPFPIATTFGTNLSPTNNGSFDGVAVALRADTSFVITSGFWGGSEIDQGTGIAIDRGALDFHYTGFTFSANAPVCLGAGNPFPTCQAAGIDTAYNGDRDSHITRFTNVGTPLGSTYLGDPVNALGDDQAYGVALDDASPPNIYIGGRTTGPGFPTTPGAFDTTHNGFADLFVTKFNPTLSTVVYSTFIGGSGFDLVHTGGCIAVNSAGMAHIVGSTSSSNFPVTASAPPSVLAGGGDATITKLNPAGTRLLLSAYIGGSDIEEGIAIRLNPAGTLATITGFTASADFPTTPGALDTSFNGNFDVFATQVDSVFDLCIQSPLDPNVLLVSSTTGAFKYCSPLGFTITGTGSVRVRGCTTTIAGAGINIVINTCSRFGHATVSLPFASAVLSDPNIDDNICLCP